ncbi:hypothetical protein [Rhizobium sp. Root1203]|uniref:hypothetical protein n=1 Tax=Rhizobium sp. Root1203 TaxID=1736427 RepID=UPI001FCDB7A4|nr:hypothetical protein [Rhizobium sp. Root1203]
MPPMLALCASSRPMLVENEAKYSWLEDCVLYRFDAEAAPNEKVEIAAANVINEITFDFIVVFMGRKFSLFGRNVRNSYKYEVFKRR